MALSDPAVPIVTAGGTAPSFLTMVEPIAAPVLTLTAIAVVSVALVVLLRRRRLSDAYRGCARMMVLLVAGLGVAQLCALAGNTWSDTRPIAVAAEAAFALLALVGAGGVAAALPKLVAEPTSRELLEAQQRRAAEDDERRMLVASLIQLNNELEQRVADRTSELAAAMKRFEVALAGSNITVAEQDSDLRYRWVYNAPGWLDPAAMIGALPREVMTEAAARQFTAAKRRVLETGRSEHAQIRYEHGGETIWYDERVEPLIRDDRIVGVVTVAIDVTQHKRYEQRLRALLRELTHRSKNLLAVVQGIARQTAESVETMPDFIARFGARLQALSGVHELLVAQSWQGVDLAELVARELEREIVDASERVTIDGERELLSPEAAQNLALGLHEMATNALRHGALSVDGGRVAIAWRRLADKGEPTVELRWQESGGPPVAETAQLSFGRSLIERLVPRALDGTSDLRFERDGLVWTLRFPVGRVTSSDGGMLDGDA